MVFRDYYLGCLAHASYLIGDAGVAAVVDPRRDVDLYLSEAQALGLEIRHVIETHVHADFVSGHIELAQRTGARIYLGRRAQVEFEHVPMSDGDELEIGELRLRFLETPGHTPESVCVLVSDRRQGPQPLKLLTGDTLFIGDVGRPDLVGSLGHSPEAMAGMLYDSLHQKLLPLPDAVEIHPAHGAGSACGRNISSETSSTLGVQRLSNYALAPMSREQFVRLMTEELPPPPAYFPHGAALNRRGPQALAELPTLAALDPARLAAEHSAGCVVLDVRDAHAFGSGHVPGSLNIGLAGSFAPWAGALLAADAPVALVADERAAIEEARIRLARVGLERVVGYLDGGLRSWDAARQEVAQLPQLQADQLADWLAVDDPEQLVLDVRRPSEHQGGHIPGALNLPLEQLPAHLHELSPERPTVVVCQSGYRSSTAASLLARAGFARLYNLTGGTAGWIAAGHPAPAEPR